MSEGLLNRLKRALSDRYAVQEELGAGGMATVYLAEDLKLGRKVAVKVLRPELAVAIGPERFLREIEIAAKLHHPHILPLHDSGEADGFLYFVMPYVAGESLRDRLDREKQLPIEDALRIAGEVADALGSAHRHDVVHRDIKPENILLEEGHAVVADFGIARAIHEAGGDKLTETGLAVGTPAYMSPEQAGGGAELDGRSDLYSLGCVLYEMLGGEPPFTGGTVQSIVHQHLTVEPRPVTALRPAVPGDVSATLARVLSKTPADRFSPAAQFADALLRGRSPDLPRPSVWSRRAAVIGAALGVTAIVVVASLIAFGGPTAGALMLGRATRLTQAPGLEVDPALSPDGDLLAYVGFDTGRATIYVRQLAGTTARSVIEGFSGPASWPRWSPDGQDILFASGEELFLVPGLGGVPRPLWSGISDGPVRSPAWSPDGERVAYAQGDAIYVAALSGAPHNKIADVLAPHGLAWGPDGRFLAYASGNPLYTYGPDYLGTSAIGLVRPDGGDPAPVVSDGYLNVSPAWTPDGRLWYVSNRGGGRDIWQIDVDGRGSVSGDPERVTTGAEAHTINLSGTGPLLAYSRFRAESNVRSFLLPEPGSPGITDLTDHTVGAQVIEGFALSPDGQWLLFDSDRNGNQDIYKVRLSGGEPIQLTDDPSDDFVGIGGWSPEGTHIVFHSLRTGNRDIFIMSADGGSPTQITDDPSQDRRPAWSPDGNVILFGRDGAGIHALVRSEPGLEWVPTQILERGRLPRWSSDGSYLAYQDGNVIYVTDPAGNDPRRVAAIEDLSTPDVFAWSAVGQMLYYVDGAIMWMVGVEGGVATPVASLTALSGLPRGFEVRGGRVFFSVETSESNVWVAELSARD